MQLIRVTMVVSAMFLNIQIHTPVPVVNSTTAHNANVCVKESMFSRHGFRIFVSDMNRCYYQSSLCQNGGTCVPGSDGAFTCRCPASYNGVYCSQYIQISGLFDCLNSAVILKSICVRYLCIRTLSKWWNMCGL